MGIEYLKSLPTGTIVYANESTLSDKYIIVDGGVLLTWEEMEGWAPISWPHRASAATCLKQAPPEQLTPDDNGKTATPPPTDTRDSPI